MSVCYIISYDLRGENADYAKLYEALKGFGTWAHITESTWAVVSTMKAAELRDHLASFMNSGDRLFVVKSGTAGAWRNVICRNEWLQKNL